MSGDNYRVCPACKKKRESLSSLYGKVSEGEYLLELSKRQKLKSLPDNLREDYEIFVDEDGLFYVSYSCLCSECGFTHIFRKSETLNIT